MNWAASTSFTAAIPQAQPQRSLVQDQDAQPRAEALPQSGRRYIEIGRGRNEAREVNWPHRGFEDAQKVHERCKHDYEQWRGRNECCDVQIGSSRSSSNLAARSKLTIILKIFQFPLSSLDVSEMIFSNSFHTRDDRH